MSGIDQATLIKYGIGALLLIAGAVLIYIGQPNYGYIVIGLGMTLLGYSVGYKLGSFDGYQKGKASVK